MTTLKPTVLLATRNRASTLEAVLNEYCRLEVPPAGWGLVVVDNGSTDRTKDVVHSFRDRLPITYCFEGTPGKNAALNTGLPLVTGDLIVFTDDDIFPRPDWLLQLCSSAEAHESYSVIAGIIKPRWEIPPSALILGTVPLGYSYSIHPPHVREGPARPTDAYGGNVAIRADVFRAGYRFDPSIGPRPAMYTMGSEAELMHRLARNGAKVWCCEQAVVEHLIPRAHMETAWLLRRAVRWGRFRYRFGEWDAQRQWPTWFGVPRWIFRAAAIQIGRIARAIMARDHAALFHARWNLRYLEGLAIEAQSTARADGGPRDAQASQPNVTV